MAASSVSVYDAGGTAGTAAAGGDVAAAAGVFDSAAVADGGAKIADAGTGLAGLHPGATAAVSAQYWNRLLQYMRIRAQLAYPTEHEEIADCYLHTKQDWTLGAIMHCTIVLLMCSFVGYGKAQDKAHQDVRLCAYHTVFTAAQVLAAASPCPARHSARPKYTAATTPLRDRRHRAQLVITGA